MYTDASESSVSLLESISIEFVKVLQSRKKTAYPIAVNHQLPACVATSEAFKGPHSHYTSV